MVVSAAELKSSLESKAREVGWVVALRSLLGGHLRRHRAPAAVAWPAFSWSCSRSTPSPTASSTSSPGGRSGGRRTVGWYVFEGIADRGRDHRARVSGDHAPRHRAPRRHPRHRRGDVRDRGRVLVGRARRALAARAHRRDVRAPGHLAAGQPGHGRARAHVDDRRLRDRLQGDALWPQPGYTDAPGAEHAHHPHGPAATRSRKAGDPSSRSARGPGRRSLLRGRSAIALGGETR